MDPNQSFTTETVSRQTIPNATLSSYSLPPYRPQKRRRLLWVDDSRPLLSLYKSVFETLGYEVHATCSARGALDHLSLGSTDLAILDYEMPEMDGGALARVIKNRHPKLPVILYSGSPCIPMAAHEYVDAICQKTAPREELRSTLERLCAGGTSTCPTPIRT